LIALGLGGTMKCPCALALSLCVASSPAFAQSAADSAGASKKKPFELEASVAPKWAFITPATGQDVENDSTVAALKLTYTAPLTGFPFTLKIGGGPSFTLDDDDDFVKDGDPQSELGFFAEASAPLNKKELPVIGEVKLFGKVARTWEFANYLSGDTEARDNFETGIKVGGEVAGYKGTELKGTAAVGATNHSENEQDQHYSQAKINFVTPLFYRVDFDVEGSWTRRYFENIDADFGVKQRRRELGLSIGLDVARWLRNKVGDSGPQYWIRSVKGGYALFEEDSNLPGKYKEKASPSFTFALGHYF
jgi:hypothetical protein